MARDPTLDLVRILAIVAVVVGHWLALFAARFPDDAAKAAFATWPFQVMPLFFLVGGAVNAGSWARARARGEPWAAWVRRRAVRLLSPLLALVAFWAVLTPLLAFAGLPSALASDASRLAFLPVWFLGVYVAVVALVPWTTAAHGRGGLRVQVALVAAIAAVDLVARRVPFVGEANVLLVWGAIHQAGYFWPRLPAGWRALAATLVGLLALAVLVLALGYPVRMVTLGEAAPSNASPPTLALIALALAQLGLVRAAEPHLARGLQAPRVRRALAVLGTSTLTLFLWHMSAIVLTGAFAYAQGTWPDAPDLAPARWPSSALHVLLALALLVVFVAAFRRFEAHPREAAPLPLRTAVGLVAVLGAIAWIVRHGVLAPGSAWPASTAALVALVAGLAALGALPRWRRTGSPPRGTPPGTGP